MAETTQASQSKMTKRQAWISAMRLRTLPLAIAGILMGTFLAAAEGAFNFGVAFFAVLTAVLLQILSNLANDYGDSVHGADSAERKGPSRAVQAGLISLEEMRRMMGVFALLSCVSGLILVALAVGMAQLPIFILFIVIGAAAVWAAVNYTAGSNPYGYAGFGDLFVLLFFGLASVLGGYYLQTLRFSGTVVLPALSVGLFAVAVLNINNIRDMISDEKAGKISIPVRLGWQRARIYHLLLIGIGIAAAFGFVFSNQFSAWELLFVVALPLLLANARNVVTLPREKLDPLLKQMSLTTLLFVLTFGIGQILGA